MHLSYHYGPAPQPGCRIAEWSVAPAEGGDLRRYYPLPREARSEYEAWLKAAGDFGDRMALWFRP